MKIQPITIDELSFVVKPVNRPDNLRAFCELNILKNDGDTVFKVKGFTIREKVFRSGTVLTVSFPAIKTTVGFVTVFIAHDKNLWSIIQNGFLEQYDIQQNPEGYTEENMPVKDADIPF